MNIPTNSSRRARVTISIRRDILSRIDTLIDGLTVRSRSQAVEFLLTKMLGEKLSTALVLAGGRPKEISIGKTIKFMAKIGNKTLLETVLEHLHGLGINKFIIYVDYKGKELIDYLNSRSLSYSMRFISAKKASGTAKPLLMARPYLKDSFLLAYGDTICRMNLSSMYEFHKENSSIATVALTSVAEPKEYGVATMEGAKISGFVEKPRKTVDSYLVNAGYFIFEPAIFSYITKKDRSLEKDVLPRLAQQGLLYGYPFHGLYLNINKKSDLEKARILL